MVLDQLLGLGTVRGPQVLGIPIKTTSEPISDVAQQRRLGERSRVAEGTSRRAASLDRLRPLLVMADGVGDGFRRALKILELLLGQKRVASVVGDERLQEKELANGLHKLHRLNQ